MPDKTLSEISVPIAYRAVIEKEKDGIAITFPELPGIERLVCNDDDHADSLMRLAVEENLKFLIEEKLPIPAPKPASLSRSISPYERNVPVSVVLGMKAMLADKMRRDGVSNVELARALKCDEKQVRRMLEPEIRQSQLTQALEALGVPVGITVVDVGKNERSLRVSTQTRKNPIRMESVAVFPSPKKAK